MDSQLDEVPSQARLTAVVDALCAAVARVIEDQHITEAEWYGTLRFLADVAHHDELVLLSDVLGLSVVVDEVNHPATATTTPTDVAGPFWRPAPLLPNPGSLVTDADPGERLTLSGFVRGEFGQPVEGAELDFWQCDADGLYDVQRANDEPRLRGRLLAGAEGHYELRTIVPPPYQIKADGPVGRLLDRLGRHAWRPAHIHVKVTAPGWRPLTTMLFIDGDPWFGQDVIGGDKPGLVVKLDRSGEGGVTARYDLVLAAGAAMS